MPLQWVEGELVLEHEGIEVRHTYKDDLADNPPLDYWFEINGYEFDIRDLFPGTHIDGNDLKQQADLLRKAIDTGLLDDIIDD